jgi:hypothetical protein
MANTADSDLCAEPGCHKPYDDPVHHLPMPAVSGSTESRQALPLSIERESAHPNGEQLCKLLVGGEVWMTARLPAEMSGPQVAVRLFQRAMAR